MLNVAFARSLVNANLNGEYHRHSHGQIGYTRDLSTMQLSIATSHGTSHGKGHLSLISF